ncbi:MAG TPA: hypothetical protein VN706_07410 [Gemmatimonadaceae bacterium]|nr:hypothetical protein [Gemmatimonadaceae bacterium]
MQQPTLVCPSSASGLLTVFGLALSIVSLVLAFYAIWQANDARKEANKVNAATLDLLLDVRTDAKSVATILAPELKEYGAVSRQALMQRTFRPTETLTATADDSGTKATPDVAPRDTGASNASS